MPSQTMETPPGEELNVSSEKSFHSPQEKTEILRKCVVQVKELENNINKHTAERLRPIVDEADKIFEEGTVEEKVKNMEEAVLDSEVVNIAAHVIRKCSAALTRDISDYDPIEFAEKIQQYIRRMPDTIDDHIDWSRLGRQVMGCFKKTANFTMVLGTLRPIPKKDAVVRRKTVRQAQAPIKRPEKVITVDKVEDSVEETIKGIMNLINDYQNDHNNESLDFFSLVLHPTSYGKTIENMLHTAFLVRDGKIKFTIDEDGIPYVLKSKGPKDQGKQAPSANSRNIQNVLSLNMAQWKALVDAYGIKKPMIDLGSKK